MNKDAVELKHSEEKGSQDPEPKQTPVSAQSYQRMTSEQKKLHFPVNRAMRRKQGLR